MREMTERQSEILEFIIGYVERNGYSPVVSEIAYRFDIKPNAARDHILALERKGMIKRTHNIGRSIVVLGVYDRSLKQSPSHE